MVRKDAIEFIVITWKHPGKTDKGDIEWSLLADFSDGTAGCVYDEYPVQHGLNERRQYNMMMMAMIIIVMKMIVTVMVTMMVMMMVSPTTTTTII